MVREGFDMAAKKPTPPPAPPKGGCDCPACKHAAGQK